MARASEGKILRAAFKSGAAASRSWILAGETKKPRQQRHVADDRGRALERKERRRAGSGVQAVGRPRNARYGMPPDVHVVWAKGREYFYFQKNRREKDEGPRVKLAGRPYDEDGTPNAEWWKSYRALAGIEGDEDKGTGTFAALIGVYKVSPEWTALSKRTIVEWTRHLA
jgi:hypothetical protein